MIDPQLLEQAVAAMERLGWGARIVTPTHNKGQLLAFKNFKQLDAEGDLWIWVEGSDIENAQAIIALSGWIRDKTGHQILLNIGFESYYLVCTVEGQTVNAGRFDTLTEAVIRAFIAVSGGGDK